MSVYSLVVTGVNLNLNSSIKLIKSINRGLVRQIRRDFSMQTRVNQKKSYVAVEIPKEAQSSLKKSIWTKFRRKQKTEVEIKAVQGMKSDLKRLLSLAKPEKYYLMGAIGFLIVSSTVTMTVPFSIGKVLDIIYSTSHNTEEASKQLNQVVALLLCVFGVGAICNFARVYMMSAAGYRMTQALRKNVFSAILRQEQGWFDKRSTGELVNRLSSDTQIVGQALSTNISDGLRSAALVCAGTGMMFYTSAELACVGLAIVPPVAGVAIIYGRFVRRISKKVQDSLAETTKIAEERIANVKTVKTFGHEFKEISVYDVSIGNVLKIAYKEAKARAFFYGMTGLTANTIILSVLYYGGVMVSSHSITVGQLSAFLLYAAYIGISIGGVSAFYTELNKSIGAGSRIWEIMDREPIMPLTGGIIPLEPPKGKIVFKDVVFSYPSREDILIFDSLNLELEPGRMVAVVGPSGSGKSTLAALILRLYDPSNGAIYLDDYQIQDLDPIWLKRFIGTVAQEPVLFSKSIRDNILYGLEDPSNVSEEKFLEVSREANVHEFVDNLPQGYNTLVGERGIMLSGGQKQRVAIARALIKDPKILLLDEATSALDAQSEHLVQEALERVMQGRTVLTIAHRLSTIQNADSIAVLVSGKIVEKGTYAELRSLTNGVFNELVKHQTFTE